eukprot:15458217-Alexandrium_andersonii.AAC.1
MCADSATRVMSEFPTPTKWRSLCAERREEARACWVILRARALASFGRSGLPWGTPSLMGESMAWLRC